MFKHHAQAPAGDEHAVSWALGPLKVRPPLHTLIKLSSGLLLTRTMSFGASHFFTTTPP